MKNTVFDFDELEWPPELQEEAENQERFSYDDVPSVVVALLDAGQVDRALDEAIRHGDTDPNHLSDLVFFKLFPDRGGRFIAKSDSDYSVTSQTWLKIRSTEVEAALQRARTTPPASGTPCYRESTASRTTAGIQRVWVFYEGVPVDPRNVGKFVANVIAFEVTDLALEINSRNDTAFSLSNDKVSALKTLALEFCHIGVDLHLMSWLRPTPSYLQQAVTVLRPVCQMTGVRSLLFDVEEPWTQNTNETDAENLLQRSWSFTGWPCALGASGITVLPPSIRPVLKRCDYLLPQAYSENKPGVVYNPGQTQRVAYTKWKELGKPIVMGLAAYNLKRPSDKGGVAPGPRLSETEAMQRAIVAAEALGVSEVAYWSLSWLRKPGAEERAAFVRQATFKARAGVSQSERT